MMPAADFADRVERVLDDSGAGPDADPLYTLPSLFRWDPSGGGKAGRRACARELAEDWAASAVRRRRGFVEVYLHAPWCLSRCLYCLYEAGGPPEEGFASAAEDIVREARYFARTLGPARVKVCRFGGGTPNLLGGPVLDRLLGEVLGLFSFERDALLSVEMHPATADDASLDAVARRGFNRLSLGVQTLAPGASAALTREAYGAQRVACVISGAHRRGIECVNADLIYGLREESLDSFIEGLRRLAGMRPTSISINRLTFTGTYARRWGASPEGLDEEIERGLAKALARIARAAEESGYDASDLRPELEVWTLFAREAPPRWSGGEFRRIICDDYAPSVLGLGPRSDSHVSGRRLYSRLPGPFSPEAPLYKSFPFGGRGEMAYYLVHVLRGSGEASSAAFHARFGRDLGRAFASEWRVLKTLGDLETDGERFRLLAVGRRRRRRALGVLMSGVLAALPAGRRLAVRDV